MMEEWCLLAPSPPDFPRLLQSIDKSDEEATHSILEDNQGLLLGESPYFGPWTLLMIAAGHRNGLWVLEKYTESSPVDQTLSKAEDKEANLTPIDDPSEKSATVLDSKLSEENKEPSPQQQECSRSKKSTSSMLMALTAPALYKYAHTYYPGLSDPGFKNTENSLQMSAFKLGKETGWTALLIAGLLGPFRNILYLLSRANCSICTDQSQKNILQILEIRGSKKILAAVNSAVESKFNQRIGYSIGLNGLGKTASILAENARIPIKQRFKLVGIKDSFFIDIEGMDVLEHERGVLPGHIARLKRAQRDRAPRRTRARVNCEQLVGCARLYI